MSISTCDHSFIKTMSIKKRIKIEDLSFLQETTSYQRKEKNFTLKLDVIGEKSPIKGLNFASDSKRESEKSQTTKLSVGKIIGDVIDIDVLVCTR